MNELAALVKGEIRGTAVVRDKHGNVKGSFTFGGEATAAQAAEVAGKPVDEVLASNGKNLIGDSHGSDTDNGRS